MGDMLKLAYGSVVLIGLAVVAHFLVAVMRRRDVGSTKSVVSGETWGGKLYMGLGLLGWLAVLIVGLNGVLAWLLPREDTRWTIAVIGALATLPVLEHLRVMPRLRSESAVSWRKASWLEENLARTAPPTDEELQRLKAQSQDMSLPRAQRQELDYQHRMLLKLKERDAQLEAALLARQEQAREEAAAAERARRLAQQAERKLAVQQQRRQLEADLTQRTPQEPVVQAIEQVRPRGVVAHDSVVELWRQFKAAIVNARPADAEIASDAAAQMPAFIARLEGVACPPQVAPTLVWTGTERDGYCDAVSQEDAGPVPLYERLQFDRSIAGLANAWFFAVVLPQKWSWGSGRKDRDAEPVLTAARLAAVLQDAGVTALAEETALPPAGIRIARTDTGYVVACLASRRGRGLYDIALTVRQGKASKPTVQELLVWGPGVYY